MWAKAKRNMRIAAIEGSALVTKAFFSDPG